MAVVIPDDNREHLPVGMYAWDFATSLCRGELCVRDPTIGVIDVGPHEADPALDRDPDPRARARDVPLVLGLGGQPEHLIVPSERRLAQQADREPSDRDIAGHTINGVLVRSLNPRVQVRQRKRR
jgi:hypothetical protein